MYILYTVLASLCTVQLGEKEPVVGKLIRELHLQGEIDNWGDL